MNSGIEIVSLEQWSDVSSTSDPEFLLCSLKTQIIVILAAGFFPGRVKKAGRQKTTEYLKAAAC